MPECVSRPGPTIYSMFSDFYFFWMFFHHIFFFLVHVPINPFQILSSRPNYKIQINIIIPPLPPLVRDLLARFLFALFKFISSAMGYSSRSLRCRKSDNKTMAKIDKLLLFRMHFSYMSFLCRTIGIFFYLVRCILGVYNASQPPCLSVADIRDR